MTVTSTAPPTAGPAGSSTSTGPSARRRRGMTEQAAEAAVDQACCSLRLPTVRTRFEDVVVAAEKEQLTYRGFLAKLLLAECMTDPAAAPPAGSRPSGSRPRSG